MPKYKAGDKVFVPVERVASDISCPFSIVTGEVIKADKRSIIVDCPYGIGRQTIASSAVHGASLSVCIIRIGDFQTELSLLDPITKSVRHFLKLLMPDDQVGLYYVRTFSEFIDVFERTSPVFTHYLIVAHGTPAGRLTFSRNKSCSAKTLAGKMSKKSNRKHNFIWLCCHSGDAKFAKYLSSEPFCDNHVGSFRSLSGASASHFAQGFFVYHLLEGNSFRVAFKKAVASLPATDHFRHWCNGKQRAIAPSSKRLNRSRVA